MTSPSHECTCGTTTHTESLVGALGAPGTLHRAPHLLSGVRWAATVSRRVQISSLAWRVRKGQVTTGNHVDCPAESSKGEL